MKNSDILEIQIIGMKIGFGWMRIGINSQKNTL
jgi:hypothetical protein